MTTTYSAWETDSSLEQKGIWIEPGGAGSFLVARAGGSNKAFTKRFQRLMKPHRKAIQADALQDEAAMKIMVESFVDTALLDWKGVTGRDGKKITFSKANALKLFDDLPDLFQDLLGSAQNYALFLMEIREEDAGN